MKLCPKAVRNRCTTAVACDAPADVRVRFLHRQTHVIVRPLSASVENVNSMTSAKSRGGINERHQPGAGNNAAIQYLHAWLNLSRLVFNDGSTLLHRVKEEC